MRPPPACPACGGAVAAAGPTERDGLACGRCGACYRHPRLALLLSLALPGLGSIYLGRRARGFALLGFGSAAFAATLWRMAGYLRAAYGGEPQPIGRFVGEVALGIGLVVLAYAVDLLLLWLRRDPLVPRVPP